ncbi:MAG: hypothetical protein JO040_00835 [Gemmatimonadetes bacterium]|nr:hypothetical protein [Gemmatimonadota bacterium]
MVRVTIDIFSGRPNPSFVLDEREAQEILRQIAATPETAVSAERSLGILGYRGLVLELDDDAAKKHGHLPRELRVGGGVAGNESRGLEIAQRLVEKMGKLVPAVEGVSGPLASYEGLDLKRLVNEGINGISTQAASFPAQEGTTSTADAAPATGDTMTTQAVGDVSIMSGATVIGTDASSWTTLTVGSCSYEASAFNPNFWNAQRTTMRNNNCYNYASNRRTDTFAQPGRATGAQATVMACSNVGAGATSDGALAAPNCASSTQSPRHYMALVIWPGTDYHWYRRQSDGFWGHKPGQTAARNYDNSNNIIYDPQTANRGGYTDFCGYYFGPSNMVVS